MADGTRKHKYTPPGQVQTFLHNLPVTDDCILWPFFVDKGGYGSVGFNGRTMTAHRAALILATGQDPRDMCACHQPIVCHNRACVNPRHLRWGTHTENAYDMLLDGTHVRGDGHPQKKLTGADVQAIRSDKRKNVVIAAEYGIHKSTVGKIKKRQTWSHM